MSGKKRRKTKWPNVVRYPDGTYYAYVKPKTGGRAKEISLKTKVASEVQALIGVADLKSQRLSLAGSRLKFKDIYEGYLKDKQKEWKPRTYKSDKRTLVGRLLPFFEKISVADIDHNTWDRYVKRTTSVKDFTNHRKILRNILEWCAYQNWIVQMPLKFKLPEHTRRPRRILKPHEILPLIEAAEGKIEIFLHLILFHGLRGLEVTQRSWSDVNWEMRALVIPDTKTNVPRVIPLLDHTVTILHRHFKERGSRSRWIFPHRNNPKRHAEDGWFRKGWTKLLNESGLGNQSITPHDCRATAEKYAALAKFSKIQREKMYGSQEEIQNKTYITELHVEELRGIERVVVDKSTGVPGLEKILISKGQSTGRLRDGQKTSRKAGDL